MDMMLEQFKTIFDRHEKVKKLREMILNLAVRGKLVEQDPNDEPASVLIQRIREEKERLIEEKKIKKEKPLMEIGEEEIPYELPNGWEFIRLGNLINISSGKNLTKSNMNDDGDIPVYGGNGITGYHDNYNVDEPTIVIGRVGFYCGSIHLTENKAWITDNAFITNYPKDYICQEYLVWLLKGTNLKEEENATAQPVISGRKVYPVVVGIPPLEEQKRIVEKVDSLMAFCDKLEKSLEKKVHYGSVSAKSVFNSIGNATTTEELEETLRFILSNFKDLSLGDNAVKELKNCILQLAVQGKLVPQDLSDEPASVLLERIQEEKERLIEEKKIKKEKPLSEISEEEKPYDLQQGWEWVRLGKITDYGFNNSTSSNEVDNNTWVLELEDIEKDTSKLLKKVKLSERDFKSTKLKFFKGDVLYCKLRPYLNKVIVADEDGVCSSEIMPIKGYYNLYPKYLMYMLKRPEFIQYVNTLTYGTKMPRLGTDDARNTLIPLAPYNEQKCIVEKVDLLMQLCDELGKKIEKAKDYSNRLMESILKDSFKA